MLLLYLRLGTSRNSLSMFQRITWKLQWVLLRGSSSALCGNKQVYQEEFATWDTRGTQATVVFRNTNHMIYRWLILTGSLRCKWTETEKTKNTWTGQLSLDHDRAIFLRFVLTAQSDYKWAKRFQMTHTLATYTSSIFRYNPTLKRLCKGTLNT
jgi:hypothetical protein